MAFEARVCGVCRVYPTTAGTYLCEGCQLHLTRHWEQLPGWLEDLRVELGNGSRKGSKVPTPGGRSEVAIPINLAAADLLGAIQKVVLAAIRLLPVHLRPLRGQQQGTYVRSLAHTVEAQARHPRVVEVARDLRALLAAAERLCDLPPERVGIGWCCGEEMLSERSPADADGYRTERSHTCPTCGAAYEVEAQLRAKARTTERDYEDTYLRPVDIDRLTDGRISRRRIGNWVARGKVSANEDGKVRLGDVLDIEEAAEDAARERRRKAREREAAA